MPLWRRRPLHERLAEQGGLDLYGERPGRAGPSWREVGIHGNSRPRQWDVVDVVDGPELPVERLELVVLDDDSAILEEDVPDDFLDQLTAAVERTLQPPYRAEAVRRGDGRWAVAARAIEVVDLPAEVEGEELLLTSVDGTQELRIDGEPAFGTQPELERLGAARYESFAVRAERLDETRWAVQVAAV
jgi:hypothetical protein